LPEGGGSFFGLSFFGGWLGLGGVLGFGGGPGWCFGL
jgi:hypothetical protein